MDDDVATIADRGLRPSSRQQALNGRDLYDQITFSFCYVPSEIGTLIKSVAVFPTSQKGNAIRIVWGGTINTSNKGARAGVPARAILLLFVEAGMARSFIDNTQLPVM